MLIRPATPSDIPAIITLFKNTILAIDQRDYTGEQLAAWASDGANLARWQKRIISQHFLVAASEEMVGFGSVDRTGYLDTLFVHHLHQRQGIAQLLSNALEEWAGQQGVKRITTEASITAKPFFERNRYLVVKQQEKSINEVTLINYQMEKHLTS